MYFYIKFKLLTVTKETSKNSKFEAAIMDSILTQIPNEILTNILVNVNYDLILLLIIKNERSTLFFKRLFLRLIKI
jgi:hypothetical protein